MVGLPSPESRDVTGTTGTAFRHGRPVPYTIRLSSWPVWKTILVQVLTSRQNPEQGRQDERAIGTGRVPDAFLIKYHHGISGVSPCTARHWPDPLSGPCAISEPRQTSHCSWYRNSRGTTALEFQSRCEGNALNCAQYSFWQVSHRTPDGTAR